MKLLQSLYALGCLSEATNTLYSGKSYAGNGHLRFQITNEQQAKALLKIENEFQVDWLAPHEGSVI